MLTYKEINEFLTSFNTNSYNRSQIGNSKQLIVSIYEYLYKLNLSADNIDILISNIAYLNKDDINIALYLELLSKSLGFAKNYDLREVINVVKEIHDIYFDSSAKIPMEEYLHDTNEEKTRKLFLNRNNKYLLKNFDTENGICYVSELKLAAAIILDQKDYKEFINYIDNFEMFQDTYSPLLIFKTYNIVRSKLKEDKKLFWDILFGNEYIVALNKHNMPIHDIFKKNVYTSKRKKKVASKKKESVQLDLFSLLEAEEEEEQIITLTEDINYFQICTIFNNSQLPNYEEEKDLLLYYEKLLSRKDSVELPKLKTKQVSAFVYELN